MNDNNRGPLDDLYGSGAPALKFPNVGDEVEGLIMDIQRIQGTDIDTGQPEVWPDGNPRYTTVVTLQTNERTDDEDDGMRSLWCSGGRFTALRNAIRRAWPAKPALDQVVGATLQMRYHHQEQPSRRGLSGRKVFACTITPGDGNPNSGLDDDIPF